MNSKLIPTADEQIPIQYINQLTKLTFIKTVTMVPEFYLWLNAVIYAIFATWCAISPTTTAAFSGFGFLNTNGRSEYFAIYVGLQGAWAVMYAVCALNPDLFYAGIFFSVFIYAGVVAGRWISIFQKGVAGNNAYYIAILEIILGSWAVLLLTNF